MKIKTNNIFFRIVVPITLLILLITIFLLYSTYNTIKDGINDYHAFNVSIHVKKIEEIFDLKTSALNKGNLLIKEKFIIEEIKNYLENNNIKGHIVTNNRVLYSSVPADLIKEILSKFHIPGTFHITKGLNSIQGYALDIPGWNMKVIIVSDLSDFSIYRSKLLLLLPLIGLSLLFILFSILGILRFNLYNPLKRISLDLRANREISKIGLAEIDEVGDVINDSIKKLNKKTEQFHILYNLATSLYENVSQDEVLKIIINKSLDLINAEFGVIVLNDNKSGIKRIFSDGLGTNIAQSPMQNKDIIEIFKLSNKPLQKDNFTEYKHITTSYKNSIIIKNLISQPIFSEEKRLIGTIYLANKSEGFTDEDITLLKVITADASILLDKTKKLIELKRFKQLIEESYDAIIITDKEGKIIYVNRSFEKVTGYKKFEVIGNKPNILKSGYHDLNFYENLWATITKGDTWKGEFINKRKDGDLYYESATIFPVIYENDISYVAIKRDITQEKKLYEQLVRAQKMEAIGTLAGGIAHDFNNILTGIMGYSDILLNMVKEGDPFYKPAKVINDAAKRGADIVKKILTITKKERLEKIPININQIIRESLDIIEKSFPKNIEIILNLDENIPITMLDSSQISQVIMNLAINAKDAMPNGGKLTIQTSLVGSENGASNGIKSDCDAKFLKLSISDTGVGMDRDIQKKIFDPFFTTKETGKGSGLGLYIAHSIINNHDGYINLYSEPNIGTTFNIYIPIVKPNEISQASQTDDLKGQGTILVIDDEENVRELCVDLLTPLGYKVLLARDGFEGIKVFRENKEEISLVILDMIMPKMGGYEVFQSLRNIRQDVSILISSGYSDSGYAGIENLLKEGACGFVQKPFSRQSIGLAIKKILSEYSS